jgi:VanZ family protein
MRKLAFWCALTTVVVLSLMPGPMLPSAINFWDKAQHALGFFGLTWLALLAYPRKARPQLGVVLLLLGGAIELAQWATGWRQGDWLDLLADAVGISTALALWLQWRNQSTETLKP